MARGSAAGCEADQGSGGDGMDPPAWWCGVIEEGRLEPVPCPIRFLFSA